MFDLQSFFKTVFPRSDLIEGIVSEGAPATEDSIDTEKTKGQFFKANCSILCCNFDYSRKGLT